MYSAIQCQVISLTSSSVKNSQASRTSKRHALLSSPVRKIGSQELRAVVDPRVAGQTPFRLQLPEDADQAGSRNRGIDLDGHGIAIKVIHHVEGAKADTFG